MYTSGSIQVSNTTAPKRSRKRSLTRCHMPSISSSGHFQARHKPGGRGNLRTELSTTVHNLILSLSGPHFDSAQDVDRANLPGEPRSRFDLRVRQAVLVTVQSVGNHGASIDTLQPKTAWASAAKLN